MPAAKKILSPADRDAREADRTASIYSFELAARSPEPTVEHAFALGDILRDLEARDISRAYSVASPLPTGIIEFGGVL